MELKVRYYKRFNYIPVTHFLFYGAMLTDQVV